MGRAARRNVEIAGHQIREVCGSGDARRIAAAAGTAVDILVVRALDRVGASERLDRGRILGQTRKQAGEIVKPARNHMDDVGFLLHLSSDGDITRAEDDGTKALERLGQTMILATAVSSSMVMKMTPLAEPGRWRMVTRPETLTRLPDGHIRSSSLRMMPRRARSGRRKDAGCARSDNSRKR